jgi:GxxExxY protein
VDRFDDEIEALIWAVIGCAIEVHRSLGLGHPESVYGNALSNELNRRELVFEREHCYHVKYKGDDVGEGRIDFWVGGRLVVEIKAVKEVDPVHVAQVVAYLTQKGEQVGLLLNFNVAAMKDKGIRRVVRTRDM